MVCGEDSCDVDNIFNGQKHVARTIFLVKGKVIRVPENMSHLVSSKLNWINIFNWVKFTKTYMVYKCRNNLAPQYISKYSAMFEIVTTLDKIHSKT